MVPTMSFMDRFKPGQDPMEPASPPPFVERDRVVVQSLNDAEDLDGQILNGQHGEVTAVWFTANPDDAFGPWVVKVRIDGDVEAMLFHADELVRETKAPTPAPWVAKVTVSQPEDDPDQPVPYTFVGQVGPDAEQIDMHDPYRREVSGEARAQEILFSEAVEVALPQWTAKFSGGAG